MSNQYIESSLAQTDLPFEMPLRPESLREFEGQVLVKQRLEVMIEAANLRKEPLSHCLLSGPPGLGKTTLAHILAKSMGSNLTVTSGPILEKAGDLAGILTHLKQSDILFIDEIHRMNKQVEEYLYSAMEDFKIDLMIDTGANARSVQLKIAPFTLVAATTRSGLLSAPLRSRFPITCRLDYYDTETLAHILMRTAKIMNTQMDSSSALKIAERSRGTPRIANNLLRWVRDYAQVKHKDIISEEVVELAFGMLNLDERGLDTMDLRILSAIIDFYKGGPVGIDTIAVAMGEESETIEEVHEPYLIMQGFIERTPRGRKATQLAYRHLNKTPP